MTATWRLRARVESKLYKNVDGGPTPFLVFHISDAFVFPDLEKFTGGDVGTNNGKMFMSTKQGAKRFDIGDYVIYITDSTPFSRVRVTLDKVRHSLPSDTYLLCKPDEFARNFKEVSYE